mmetsp:Transcript_29696/g.30101  ORF Transcript_29696/g.30101 Transcript_29696/m.30101 type:complete len:103 (+) Transcript_29696:222-530(+)
METCASLIESRQSAPIVDQLKLLTGTGLQKCKVSSVLNKSAEFAGQNMFDYGKDSCWNSDQGAHQFVMIDFQRNVCMTHIGFIFQGGFVGKVRWTIFETSIY